MVAALVTALGAVLVAVVALAGNRVEARDTRSRLAKDVDVMLKLDPDSPARRVLEIHVADSARILADQDQRRWKFNRPARLYLLAVGTGIVGIAIDIAIGGSNHQSIAEYARELASPMRWVLLVWVFLLFVLGAVTGVIAVRKLSRWRKNAKDIEEREAANQEGGGGTEPTPQPRAQPDED